MIHQDRNPTIRRISGNMDDDDILCPGPELHVAYLFNRHYQSILPKNAGIQKVVKVQSPRTFLKSSENQELLKQSSQPSQTEPSQNLSECPACNKELKSVIQHINKSKACQKKLGDEKVREFRSQAKKAVDERQKETHKIRQANFKKRKLEEDTAAFKASQNA